MIMIMMTYSSYIQSHDSIVSQVTTPTNQTCSLFEGNLQSRSQLDGSNNHPALIRTPYLNAATRPRFRSLSFLSATQLSLWLVARVFNSRVLYYIRLPLVYYRSALPK